MPEPKLRCVLITFQKFPVVEFIGCSVLSECEEKTLKVYPHIDLVNVELCVPWFSDADSKKTVDANIDDWIAIAQAGMLGTDITSSIPPAIDG